MTREQSSAARRVAWLAGLASWTSLGCASRTREVLVREPAAVAVLVDDQGALPGATPHEALPAGATSRDEVVFQQENPFLADDEVHAVRRGDGSVVLECRPCSRWPSIGAVSLVEASGRLRREESTVRVVGDSLEQRFDVRLARSIVVTGWYVTPWSNVVEVRERRGADPRAIGGTLGGMASVIGGTALAAAGGALVVGGARASSLSSGQRNGYYAIGGGALALGLGLDAFALWHLLGPSEWRRVWP